MSQSYRLQHSWDVTKDDRDPDDILGEAQDRFACILDGYLAEGFTQTAPVTVTITGQTLTLSTHITGPPGWEYNTKRTEG